MSYQYKVVPVPMVLRSATKKTDAAKEFSNLIQTVSESGWEFSSVETVTMSDYHGFFGDGEGAELITNCTVLVFRKPIVE